MAVSGELATMDVADVLWWVSDRERSGTLSLARLSTEKKIGFGRGRVTCSISNDPRETLGQALVRDGLVSEANLFKALLKQETEGRLLGEILVSGGLLSAEPLRRVLEGNAEEVVYDVFLWPDGRFKFDEAETLASPVPLDMDLGLVIREGLHRREQWNDLRRRLPSSEVTFRLAPGAAAVEDPADRRILELASESRTLASISLETRRSRYESTLRLHALCERGALVADASPPGALEADPVGAIRKLRERGAQALGEGRLDAAAQAYEQVLAMDRLDHEARKGLLAVSEARRQSKLLARVGLDHVPTLRLGSMALTREHFDPHEGFVISRINGQWPVRAILKLCPMPESETLAIFGRLLEREVIDLTAASK